MLVLALMRPQPVTREAAPKPSHTLGLEQVFVRLQALLAQGIDVQRLHARIHAHHHPHAHQAGFPAACSDCATTLSAL